MASRAGMAIRESAVPIPCNVRTDATAAPARGRRPGPTPAKHAPAPAGGPGQGTVMASRAGMAIRENEVPIPCNVRTDATAAPARGRRPEPVPAKRATAPSRGPGSGHGHGVVGGDRNSRKRGSDPMQREDGRNGGTGAGQAGRSLSRQSVPRRRPGAAGHVGPWRCGPGWRFAKTRFRSHAT
jgi:hypothetical protein